MMISVGRHDYWRSALAVLAVAVVFRGGVTVSVYGIRARHRSAPHAMPLISPQTFSVSCAE